jgi:hypothetical protein
MSPHRARAAIHVAMEASITGMMQTLEGIKAEYHLTDAEVTARLVRQGYPAPAEWWLEWRQRQAPLTEQIPIVEQSIGDVNDL